jgi:hypothetical protein
MKTKISAPALACVAVLTLGAAGAAQAQDDVYWSIGMSAPGMQVGVSNAPAVVVQAPVYVHAQPPVYVPAPVYVQPRTVYVAPRTVYYAPAYPLYYGHPGNGWGRGDRGEHEGYRGHGERGEHEGYRGYGDRGEHVVYRGYGSGEPRIESVQRNFEMQPVGRGDGRTDGGTNGRTQGTQFKRNFEVRAR